MPNLIPEYKCPFMDAPYAPYILVNDKPKVAALKRKFPALYKG